MPRVIISSGHTTSSPGTIVDDIREVDVSRKIAKEVTSILRYNGVITLSVPYDLELQKRISWINSTGYKQDLNDLLIEIHSNEGGKTGVEAWFSGEKDGKSYKLAKTITNNIRQVTQLEIQGLKNESEHELGSIEVLKEVNATSVLLECLYLDNKNDRTFLEDEDKLKLLAKSICEGITKFFGIDFKDPYPNIKPIAKADLPGSRLTGGQEKAVPEKQAAPKPMPKPDFVKPAPAKPAQTPAKPVITAKQAPKPIKSDFTPFTAPKPKSSTQAGGAFPGLGTSQNKFTPPAYGNNSPFSLDNNDADINSSLGNDDDMFGEDPAGGSFGGTNLGGLPGSTGGSFGGGNLGTPSFGGAAAFGGDAKKPLSRDERKEMIQKYYKKALGVEPKQSDLNYFLNIGIAEDQFLKRIIDSQDHLDIVENAKKYSEIKEKFDKIESESESLKRSLKDQREIMEKLNSLLLQKNQALSQMQKRVQFLMRKLEDSAEGTTSEKSNINYKGSTMERIFDFFSNKLS